MYEKLRAEVLPYMVPEKARILVAVSGGPDSVALSHILWRYAREEPSREISLVFTHVHHGVRKESDEEVLLVRNMAEKWGVTCLVHYFEASAYAKAQRQSFQEAARDWRYARWQEDMVREKCGLLATAHHLGDQAETILYRLLRGSGPAGLAGIYPAKDALIRPLLGFGKEDILRYCAQEALTYAVDHSNEEPVYVRNKIRLELLPELEKKYNPRLQEVLGRTGTLMRWDEEYLTVQVEAAWRQYSLPGAAGRSGLSRDVFREPAAILSRLLRKAAMLATGEPRGLGFHYVQQIMGAAGKPGWKQDLPGLRVEIDQAGIWFMDTGVSKKQAGEAVAANVPEQRPADCDFPEIVLQVGQWSAIPGLQLEVGLWEEGTFLETCGTFSEAESNRAVFGRTLLHNINNNVSDRLVCRTRRPGDKMWFQGVGHKALKKIFQEEKIPEQRRSGMPLIACGSEVLWIPGLRQGNLFPPDKRGQNIFCVLRPRKLDSL